MRKLIFVLIIAALIIGCKVPQKSLRPKGTVTKTQEKKKNGKVVRTKTTTITRY